MIAVMLKGVKQKNFKKWRRCKCKTILLFKSCSLLAHSGILFSRKKKVSAKLLSFVSELRKDVFLIIIITPICYSLYLPRTRVSTSWLMENIRRLRFARALELIGFMEDF